MERTSLVMKFTKGQQVAAGRQFVDLAITRNGAPEQTDRIGADAAEIVEFELEEQGVVRGAGNGPRRCRPCAPTSNWRCIPGQRSTSSGFAVAQGEVIATNGIPARRNRPLAGKIDLVDRRSAGQRIARIAVAGRQHLAVLGLEPRPGRETFADVVAVVVFPGDVGIGLRGDQAIEGGDDIREIVLAVVSPGIATRCGLK